MGNAAARAHELNLAGTEGASVAHAVFVLKCAFKDVAEDFHIAVRMGGEARPRCNDILIDDTQTAEAHVRGIVVISKAESVVAIEPAMVGMATLGGFAKGEFHSIGGFGGDAACGRKDDGCMEKLASFDFHNPTLRQKRASGQCALFGLSLRGGYAE